MSTFTYVLVPPFPEAIYRTRKRSRANEIINQMVNEYGYVYVMLFVGEEQAARTARSFKEGHPDTETEQHMEEALVQMERKVLGEQEGHNHEIC